MFIAIGDGPNSDSSTRVGYILTPEHLVFLDWMLFNARAPPDTVNHLQQVAQRGSIGIKVGASLTTCSQQISMWKKTSIATILDNGFTSHPVMVDILNFLKKGA